MSFVLIVSLMLAWHSKADTLRLEPESLDFEIYDVFLDDGLLLFESTDIYVYEGKVLLPFNTLVSALEINLSYDHQLQRFTGRLNSKDVDLSLLSPVDAINWPVLVVDTKEQLFIDPLTLGFLFDMDVLVEVNELRVVLTPKLEPFPLQVRIARVQRKVVAQNESVTNNYDFIVDDQYRMFTPPSGAVSLSLTANQTEQDYNVNVNTYNDLFYHSANLSLSKNEAGGLTKRLTLSRDTSNPTDTFIGGLTRYSFGDVSSSNNDGRSLSGAGLVFSSFENRYTSNFGKITIDEYVTANWSVELYQNGFLIDTGLAGADGHIVFKDVNVNYGSNRFEIKTYGDFGETQNIIRNVLIGNNLLRPGEFKYAGGIVDTAHSLFNDNGILNAEDDYTPRVFFQSEFGLNHTTSLGLSVYFEKDLETDLTNNEAIFSLTHQLSNALLDFNLVANDNDSFQLDGNIIGSLGKWSRYQFGVNYNNGNDSETEQIQPEKIGASANFSSRIGLFAYGLSGSFDSEEQTFGTNVIERRTDELSSKLSWRYKKINISNELTYNKFYFDDGVNAAESSEITERISISSSLSDNIYLRSTGTFDLSDTDDPFTSIDANLNWRLSNKLNFNANAEYFKDGDYRVTSSANWRRDDYNLTFGANFSNDDRWQVSLGIRFGLDYDYYQNKMNLTSEYGAATGTLDLLTFIDNNKNAVYDEYDEALENVGFGSSPHWHQSFSNNDGVAYLPGVASRTPVKVHFDTNSSRAPNLKPIHENFAFYTHPGGVSSLDVPFNYALDLEGNVVMEESLRGFSAKLIPIQILDKQGLVVKETFTSFDNYYIFTGFWPGQYRIRIEPEFLANKSLKSEPETIILQITGAEEFLTMEDFVLSPISSIEIGSVIEPIQDPDTNVLAEQPSYFYNIQLGAYSGNDNCQFRVNELKRIGIMGVYYQQDYPLCKVYLGKFDNIIIAQQELKKIQSTVSSIQGFVTRIVSSSVNTLNVDPVIKQENNLISYSIQLGAYTTAVACDEKLQEAIRLRLPLPKQLNMRGLCKVYSGEYSSTNQAQLALSKIPASIFRGAFFVRL
jgi:hypothetical protein